MQRSGFVVQKENDVLLSRPMRWYSRLVVVAVGLLFVFAVVLARKENSARKTDLRDSQNLHNELSKLKPSIAQQERLSVFTGPGFFTVESARFIEYELHPIQVEWVATPLVPQKQNVLVHSSHPDFANAGGQRTQNFALVEPRR
ncbi:MAG: hypothetical protein JNM27_00335 [Leptospirales bacterium]|nr:hypothetical protein [Leptospirales bacterium]